MSGAAGVDDPLDGPPPLTFRRPTEGDHRALVDDIERWFGGRRMRPPFGRMWFVHFTSTSWVAEDAEGRIAAILIGFASPDRPMDAVVHLAAVDPNLRRRGIGSTIHRTWLADMARRGATRAIVAVPPDERVVVRFYRSLGFEPELVGATPLWGVPAFADYDAEGADRALFTRPIEPAD